MRIAILCNGRDVAVWQRRALDAIRGKHELLLLVCKPARPGKRRAAHALYYALNLVTIRNRLTRTTAFPVPADAIAARLDFEPTYEGTWAILPSAVLTWIGEQRVDAIVKFELGLLRIPDTADLPVPILSYHHGDPRTHRGRPAGFYEVLEGTRFVGQIVQVLSNRLDAGTVLAFAQSRVQSHSYRRTLLDAYALSPWLLGQALDALQHRRTLPLPPTGRNNRLPGNLAVIRFAAACSWRLARRLAYGAFVEKRWNVATIDVDPKSSPLDMIARAEAARTSWHVPALLPGYAFYADGFFHTGSDDILVEALDKASGKGELVRIRGGRQQRIAGFGGHMSYPLTVHEEGRDYLVPETAGWCPPSVFEIDGDAVRLVSRLDIDEPAILDPTLYRHDGRSYLFGNRPADGASVLHLWSAPSLFGRFEPHPASPVRVSARGSRMAGEILSGPGGTYRLGQDFRDAYGDGILAFRIEELSKRTYREAEAGEAAFTSVRGPHTLGVRGDRLLFDWYVERRTPLAGVRRILARLG